VTRSLIVRAGSMAAVSALTGGKHHLIGTSRNGLGPTPDHAWCNPPGRALGLARRAAY
jgi:endoglucanase